MRPSAWAAACHRVAVWAAAFCIAAATASAAPLGDQRLALSAGAVPVFASAEWEGGTVARAVIVVHGLGRNASGYFAALQRAAATAGRPALLIGPHFLATSDAGPADLLRWRSGNWMGGLPAVSPAPVSAFDVLDALIARLADRTRFPNLTDIVLVGHSAGAQLVQRYAAVGRAAPAGIHLRYVVANPSSYLWFGPERPIPATCATYNNWKFGLAGDLPPYVTDSPAAIETRYLSRDIVYLLGGNDTDPNQRDLDRSCGGMAQGTNRLARGEAFLASLKNRHPNMPAPQFHIIAGIAHQGSAMINAPCTTASLFDTAECR